MAHVVNHNNNNNIIIGIYVSLNAGNASAAAETCKRAMVAAKKTKDKSLCETIRKRCLSIIQH